MNYKYLVEIFGYTGRILRAEFGIRYEVDFTKPIDSKWFDDADQAYVFARETNEAGQQWAYVAARVEAPSIG